MSRIALDAPTALLLLEAGLRPREDVSLVGPASLRSDVMRLLFARSLSGRLTPREAKGLMEDLASLKVRLLGDRVSRSTAWDMAQRLDWHDPVDAEVLAVASLQADALATGSARLLDAADRLGVPIIAPRELLARCSPQG